MSRPSRRLVFGSFAILTVIVLALVLNVLWGVKRAADDVGVMMVPTLELPPEPTAAPVTNGSLPANPTATVAIEPTAVPAPDSAVNILLMGTDARPGEDIARTDSMIIVRIDPKTNRVSTLSLPRDLATTIPRVGEQRRINTAYYLGEKELGKGYGPALAKETISKLLGIKIDHYVLINFDGFTKLVDNLGGVTIDVPRVIDDPKYPTDAYAGDTRTMKVHFDPGVQKMDGERALIYSRTRHADSDFGRQVRQQQVLMAIFKQIRDQNLYSQITSLDEYTSALRDAVRFDMSRDDIMSLASLAPSINANSVEHYSVSPTMLREQTSPAYYLFVNDKKAFKTLVSTFVNGEADTAKAAAK